MSRLACVQDLFPFKAYFADAPGGLFKGRSFAADMERARGCWRHLRTMFQELEECRAFELLKARTGPCLGSLAAACPQGKLCCAAACAHRFVLTRLAGGAHACSAVCGCQRCGGRIAQGQADRVNYLMTKQAKIVAMTCTHAALKRREFLELGFKFDNLLMEESAQILEIETFIPMLLQVAACAPGGHASALSAERGVFGSAAMRWRLRTQLVLSECARALGGGARSGKTTAWRASSAWC